MTENENTLNCIEAVKKIKAAILQSRYMAARLANAEQLKLYFGIGAYVSANSREHKWGTGAIEAISRRLQIELPGLRGFSARSIKYMRTFYEAWNVAGVIRQWGYQLDATDFFVTLNAGWDYLISGSRVASHRKLNQSPEQHAARL